MSAPSVKSKDAYEEGLSTADSDELQLVKFTIRPRHCGGKEKKKTLNGG
jgi:hypothetical protein